MRKTKIVCTIGPSCNSEKVLSGMISAGMNVARLNFSHGTHEEHLKNIETIKTVRDKLGAPLPILLDTKGPEYRIKTFKNGKITLEEGDAFCFKAGDELGDQGSVCVSYDNLHNELEAGDRILLNNGLLVFEVLSIENEVIKTKTISGGELSDRKSMSFPNKHLKQTYLSAQDKADIKFGVDNGIDFIACSFVSCRQDILDVRAYLKEINAPKSIDLIAKIENRAGVDNIEEISEVTDGILIGRGDLGVEIPFEELPAIQKHLIYTCRMLGKRVITATEMLESMIHNSRPTRAEISDVANAVYDGTSALMLSGETAIGKYPVQAVIAMSKIALKTEQSIDYKRLFLKSEFKIKNNLDAISHSTCGVAIDINAGIIVVCTRTGETARMVSRFRPSIDILGMTTEDAVWRKLALSWGVVPVLSEEFSSTDVLFFHAKRAAKNSGLLKKGDNIVITGGTPDGTSGNTDLIKIDKI